MAKDIDGAWSAVETFASMEDILAEALHYVPFAREHIDVWSPKFTTIIVESANQLSSLFKAIYAERIENPKSQPNIVDFANEFHSWLAAEAVIFFGGADNVSFKPFDPWGAAEGHASLEWWSAYTDLKHSRMARSERVKGTLLNAFYTLGALFLTILLCRRCDQAIMNAGWVVDGTGPGPVALADVGGPFLLVAETKLFAHEFGAAKGQRSFVLGSGRWSARYRLWRESTD